MTRPTRPIFACLFLSGATSLELEPKNPEYAAALRVLKTSMEPGQRTR